MASPQCASGSEFSDSKVSRKPCCKSDRCIDLVIEGTKQLTKAKCNGGVDVATYSHQKRALG